MLNKRELLEKHLEEYILSFISDRNFLQQIYDVANEKYNIPRSITSDYMTLRLPLKEATEFLLYCFTDVIETERKVHKSILPRYYTEQEIKYYSTSKYEVDTFKFPMIFKMIQTNDNQWIGKITIHELMELRNAQLINYNTNAQRTMQKIVRGDDEIYKVSINNSAIKSIKELYKSGIYIPTPFTLNIPEDSNANFYYNQKKNELVIEKIDHFDITDGYHRYLAACEISDVEPDFDYTMELRIVNWSDEKAKQFIWQEDQKTKMRKLDSDSLDMSNPANIVAERLNNSSQCNLSQMINRNGGLINLGDFASIINFFYFKGKNLSQQNTRTEIINVTNKLTEVINLLTEHNNRYLSEKYRFIELVSIVYLSYNMSNYENFCDIFDGFVEKARVLEGSYIIKNKKVTRAIVNSLDEIGKEYGIC